MYDDIDLFAGGLWEEGLELSALWVVSYEEWELLFVGEEEFEVGFLFLVWALG